MKKSVKIVVFTLLGVILVPTLTVGSYMSYVALSYKRIEDNKNLEINHNSKLKEVSTNEDLSITSFNIGFGAYSYDYTFFMDTGYDENGNSVTGHYGKGRSKDETIRNTNGCIDIAKEINSDFYVFQEVDTLGDRAYNVNQKEMINDSFKDYDNVYAVNYDSAYLFYPLYDPIGKSLSGLNTLSKYEIKESVRKSYTISTGFDKFFDLDRCFEVNRIAVKDSSKELVIINNHMSAYDKGGYIRNSQLNELNSYIMEEYNKGNYVVVGGDFNHDLLAYNPNASQKYTESNPSFKDLYKEKTPDWVSYLFNEDGTSQIDSSLKVYGAENVPTCRSANEVYREGISFVKTVDGFIVSSNVEVSSVEAFRVGETAFAYSDHQPTKLTFKLK